MTGPERYLLDHQAPEGLLEAARVRVDSSRPSGWSSRVVVLSAAAGLVLGLAGGVVAAGRLGQPAPSVVTADGPQDLVAVDAVVRTSQHHAKPVRLVCLAPEAGQVAVAGSWNGWNTDNAPMRAVGEGLFAVELLIPQGRHEYMFVVDGEHWIPDPSAPLAADDGFGQRNSVIEI